MAMTEPPLTPSLAPSPKDDLFGSSKPLDSYSKVEERPSHGGDLDLNDVTLQGFDCSNENSTVNILRYDGSRSISRWVFVKHFRDIPSPKYPVCSMVNHIFVNLTTVYTPSSQLSELLDMANFSENCWWLWSYAETFFSVIIIKFGMQILINLVGHFGRNVMANLILILALILLLLGTLLL